MAGGVNLCSLKVWIRRKGISLVVQQVGLSVLIAKAPGSMPGQVTEIPQAAPKAGKRSRKEEGWKGVNTREKFECLNILKAIFFIWCKWKNKSPPPQASTGQGHLHEQAFHFPEVGSTSDMWISVHWLSSGQTQVAQIHLNINNLD